MSERPQWMSDPLVAGIPQQKLDFLEQMFNSGRGKSQMEMMTFLMPMLKKARQERLTFTQEEMNAAIAAIKKYSSTEELRKIDNILDKAKRG